MYHKCKKEQNESAQIIWPKFLEGCGFVQKSLSTCYSRMAANNLSRAIKEAMGFSECQHCQECWEKETEEITKEAIEIGIGQESQTGVKCF